jgi:hypothetical protein
LLINILFISLHVKLLVTSINEENSGLISAQSWLQICWSICMSIYMLVVIRRQTI